LVVLAFVGNPKESKPSLHHPEKQSIEGKVMVYKSFPYAPCINTSQPLDFLHTLTI